MIGYFIKKAVETVLFFRYCFWKIIVISAGGRLGRGVKIYAQVKLVTGKGRPLFIGDNASFLQGVIISTSESGKFIIGDNVYIGEYSVLASNQEIVIEDEVLIAPHNNIVDFNHRFDDLGVPVMSQGYRTGKVVIKKGAWIGCNCSILKGVTIGERAVIGAGSVVVEDIPPYCVAVGNPARVIRKLA